MKTGHLERIAKGLQVSELLQGCDARADCQVQQFANLFTKPKDTISVYPISETFYQEPLLLVYQINIKRLIDDIYNGVPTLSPAKTLELNRLESYRNRSNSTETTLSDKPRKKSFSSLLKRAQIAGRGFLLNGNDSDSDHSHLFRSSKSSRSKISKSVQSSSLNTCKGMDEDIIPDLSVVQAVFSAIMSWGMDSGIDQLCTNKLGLLQPDDSVCFGFRRFFF